MGALQRRSGSSLGRGSIAGDEYCYNMEMARVDAKGEAHWVETCFCDPALEEERPYWEKYFDLLSRERRAFSPQLSSRKWDRSLGVLRLRLHRNGSKRNCRRRTKRFCRNCDPLVDAITFTLREPGTVISAQRRTHTRSHRRRARAPMGRGRVAFESRRIQENRHIYVS